MTSNFVLDLVVLLLLAVLYGCGMGGGGLLVAYLTLIRGMGQTDAQALNLFFYIISSAVSAFFLLKKRNLNPLLVVLCALSGIPGAYLGSVLRRRVSIALLQKLFGVMLILTGVSVFFSREKTDTP